MVHIVSVNANGLNDNKKRKEYMLFVKKCGYDIVLVQESHSTPEQHQIWSSEWGGRILFADGEGDARGVAIMIRPGLNIEIAKISKREDGRAIIMDCEIGEMKLIVANIYAPNDDQPQFFLDLFENISEHKKQS